MAIIPNQNPHHPAQSGTCPLTRFRPCIDLHEGRVKQIVGGTLDKNGATENHVSDRSAADFAKQYRRDRLVGGHIIQLGPGNADAARSALAAYPSNMQIGGGVTPTNAGDWLDAGASHVIVTSFLFDEEGQFDPDRLAAIVGAVTPGRLVIDLSCRRVPDGGWVVTSNRWQTLTQMSVQKETIDRLSRHCDEFLVHAADVEGLCGGVDADLVEMLGQLDTIPITYAGGIASMDDIDLITDASHGKLDYTVGSALDLFGGTKIRYNDLLNQ